ncbi:heavy metal-associated isoprenylated plant protein 3-like [Impatiens glandulifera]|uniref:heavy metal-associated isoprenylated plant protein 3-like n=1 Tax=Impatiens glandulifera TaxID=253017 RepID=UPI001FB0D5FC|nr:heavy metal-associated isoprenylated plant protein 3-like [Impatiens glandulifera]
MGENNDTVEEGHNKTSKDQNNDSSSSSSSSVVFKMDLHCIGCISKLKKLLSATYKGGVECVKADLDSNKMTLTGKVDPMEVQKFLEHKTKKKVDLVSPPPPLKKDSAAATVHDAEKKKKVEEKTEKKQDDDKKSKEPPQETTTTAVMKMSLHCEGCIDKVYKYVTKTKGYEEIKIDREKELVTVKGTMDMKALVELLKEKLKTTAVEIVQPKKKEIKDEKKEIKDGSDGGREGITTTTMMEENKIQYYSPMGYYGYPPAPPVASPALGGGQSVWGGYPNPPGFVFSDDNPNACSVM